MGERERERERERDAPSERMREKCVYIHICNFYRLNIKLSRPSALSLYT